MLPQTESRCSCGPSMLPTFYFFTTSPSTSSLHLLIILLFCSTPSAHILFVQPKAFVPSPFPRLSTSPCLLAPAFHSPLALQFHRCTSSAALLQYIACRTRLCTPCCNCSSTAMYCTSHQTPCSDPTVCSLLLRRDSARIPFRCPYTLLLSVSPSAVCIPFRWKNLCESVTSVSTYPLRTVPGATCCRSAGIQRNRP